MASLISIIQALPAHIRGAVSRVRINTGPQRSSVTISVAVYGCPPQIGIHDGGQEPRPIPTGPVSVHDAQGVVDRNPPVRMLSWERHPDIEATIDTVDLQGQIDELRRSGLVGGLNVERIRSNLVISTHAATQGERNAWLRGLMR